MNSTKYVLLILLFLIPGHSAIANAQQGKLAWKMPTSGPIISSPLIAPTGAILIGSQDEHLHAIGPDGNSRWRYETGFWVQSTPAVGANGVVYVGSWDHHLYAIKPDRSLEWKFRVMGKQPIISSPAIDEDGTIYVGSYDFDSDTGGNVTVNSAVFMETNATMVIDAWNKVNTFGSSFEDFWKENNSKNSLEVVSRTTPTIDWAADPKNITLPHAKEARGDVPIDWFHGTLCAVAWLKSLPGCGGEDESTHH